MRSEDILGGVRERPASCAYGGAQLLLPDCCLTTFYTSLAHSGRNVNRLVVGLNCRPGDAIPRLSQADIGPGLIGGEER